MHFEGEVLTETDSFFRDNEVERHSAIDSLKIRYEQLHQRNGLYDPLTGDHGQGWFKDEGGGCFALQGKLTPRARRLLPKPPPRLRLYGFRLDLGMIHDIPQLVGGLYEGEVGFPIAVFGGGGVKTRKRPEDCPNVRDHFAAIHHVQRCLLTRLADGTVKIIDEGLTLAGNLNFSQSHD